MAEKKWPQQLWVVRHGQSAGNVARDAAEAAGHALIELATRDVDVPLSPLGKQQAAALGRWFGNLPHDARPTVVLSSPYLRAVNTADLVLEHSGIDRTEVEFLIDERLREKEFGILDRLTRLGIEQKYPELHEQRGHVGKFYFRPPGGESWCDVILRLRNVIDTLTRDYCGERVLIIGHQVIVHCFRYLLERLDEETVLALDRVGDVPNCAVNSYEYDGRGGRHGRMEPRLVHFVAPLEETGTPVTSAPDAQTAPKA